MGAGSGERVLTALAYASRLLDWERSLQLAAARQFADRFVYLGGRVAPWRVAQPDRPALGLRDRGPLLGDMLDRSGDRLQRTQPNFRNSGVRGILTH